MVPLSNTILGAVNLVVFLLSIPLLGAGIWLATRLDTQCVAFLEWPIILIGAVVMLVSLAGFVGSFWRVACLLWLYLFATFLAILAILAFTIFAYAVTGKGQGYAIPGITSYVDYRLAEFSPWLQQQVRSSVNWRKIKTCIRDADLCRPLDDGHYNTLNQLYLGAQLSPLQSGCCIPPSACGYHFVKPTYWIDPSYAYADRDCGMWSNEQDELCYNCDRCKAGLLANVKEGWRKVALLGVIVLIALVIVYMIGCCAFQNARTQEYFKDYRRRYRTNFF